MSRLTFTFFVLFLATYSAFADEVKAEVMSSIISTHLFCRIRKNLSSSPVLKDSAAAQHPTLAVTSSHNVYQPVCNSANLLALHPSVPALVLHLATANAVALPQLPSNSNNAISANRRARAAALLQAAFRAATMPVPLHVEPLTNPPLLISRLLSATPARAAARYC